jgi:predicted transcriptional regulator
MGLQMPRVREEVSREREREAWRLRQQGWTQQRIADRLEVTHQAVDVMLSRIEKRLAAEFREQAEQMKGRQTAVLEQILDEALEQWRRSTEDAVTEVTVKGKVTGKGGKGKEGTDKDESRAQVTRTVEGQTGNPALLAQARGALADIRSIWGLDAQKDAPVAPGGAGGGTVVIREVIVNLPTAATEELPAGGIVMSLPAAGRGDDD